MLLLKPMPHSDFDAFRLASIKNYSTSLSRNLKMTYRRALQMAEEELKSILPRGFFSDDHFFFNLIDGETNKEVGKMWFFINRLIHSAFLYDLYIYEDFQKQGYAQSAMAAMEEFLKKENVRVIRLNVFNDNHPAKKLYEKSGYDSCNQILQKFLS